MSENTDETNNGEVMADPTKILTIEHMLTDFAGYDGNAEVAMALHGVNMTIPIGYVTSAQCDNGKKYVLMVVAPSTVKRALAFVKEKEADVKSE